MISFFVHFSFWLRLYNINRKINQFNQLKAGLVEEVEPIRNLEMLIKCILYALIGQA